MVNECFLLYTLLPKDSLPSEEMDFLLRGSCGREQSVTLIVATPSYVFLLVLPDFPLHSLPPVPSTWIPLPDKKFIFVSASVFKGAKPRY